MLNLRWYFVSPRSHFCSHESTNLDRDWLDPQEKLGWDKKYPTLNLVNDLLFVFAFFVARIVFGTKSVRVPSLLYSFDFVLSTWGFSLFGSLADTRVTRQSLTFFKSIYTERERIPLWLFCTVSRGQAMASRSAV
jgi:hypothetical protein